MFRLLMALLFTIGATSAWGYGGQQYKATPGVAMNAEFRLSELDIQALQVQAAEGDAAAAMRLFKYYAGYQDDQQAAIRWMTIAVENGDKGEVCNLAAILRAQDDDLSKRRAVFWKKKCDAQ